MHKAYGRKGYIAALLRPRAEFDDATSKVTYRIDITEGPQYRMGNLIVNGFSDNLATLVRTRWELRPGDVYDQGYADEFFKKDFRDVMRKVFEERQAQGKPAPKVSTNERPNRNTSTVDVTIEVSN